MGSIIVHAGMPKTGTSSIQHWLVEEADELRTFEGIHPLVASSSEAEKPDAAGPTGAHLPTNFYLHYTQAQLDGDGTAALRLARTFAEDLNQLVEDRGDIVVTMEAFSFLLARGDETFLGVLAELGELHEVRIAYYVRPQHEALESRWRQWGFGSGQRPSEWIRSQTLDLDYQQTRDQVCALAPNVELQMRPFRYDLLTEGDVVTDFASKVLEVDTVPEPGSFRDNPGLPLDLANLLQAESGHAVAKSHGMIRSNLRQVRLAHLAQKWDLPESPTATTTRDTLHRYAYATFEDENRDLIRCLDWETHTLIPTPTAPCDPNSDLAQLDELLSPDPAAAQAYLGRALDCLLEQPVES